MLDVLIVSLGSTAGLRAVDAELLASLRRAGASAEIVCASSPRPLRTLMLTDLAWALAARRAARAALAREPTRAVIYSTTTAALLWPRPGAIRFDALAAANRPGRHGLWQRRLERRRLREAPLLLPQSEGALSEAPGSRTGGAGKTWLEQGGMFEQDGLASKGGSLTKGGMLVLPVPVESSGADAAARDIAAITYAANPAKKGLGAILAAWARVRRPGEELWVAGAAESDLHAQGCELPAEGVRVTGVLAPAEYRSLLRRARLYVCAARREDHGIAQLEALADGCMLVTVASPGPYVALPLARELDARLVGEDIGAAMRVALDDPLPDYASRAARALAPFRREAVDRLVADELLPRFLA